MQILQLSDYSIYVGDMWASFHNFLNEKKYAKILVLVDSNTEGACFERFRAQFPSDIHKIVVPAGEAHKNIDTCQDIWRKMFEAGAGRNALLVVLGGGVMGDMGGFCASTFKRGFDFVQMPTTLLSQVDSSIGGKLGIDFFNVKNSIGVFNNPKAVFISPDFFETLLPREILSGFGEIIKHSLIANVEQWHKILSINDLHKVDWAEYLVPSLKIKQRIVEIDPFEKGIRKALNYGHTIGHAIESAALETENPLTHGEAIAIGMICEAFLSKILRGMPNSDLKAISDFIVKHYGKYDIEQFDADYLVSLMKQDKKNERDEINFSLLRQAGEVEVNCTATPQYIKESLKYYSSL
jgi:3-dehydroquinate synthase